MRFEFTNPSASRLATTFNFNYERQASLNEALLQEALGEGPGLHDLPPTERPIRQVYLKGGVKSHRLLFKAANGAVILS
jgi:hypothetical protein